jgi:hypothetical protein
LGDGRAILHGDIVDNDLGAVSRKQHRFGPSDTRAMPVTIATLPASRFRLFCAVIPLSSSVSSLFQTHQCVIDPGDFNALGGAPRE